MTDRDADREAAYNRIDRFLRNNVDDVAYAGYSSDLDAVYESAAAPGAAQAPADEVKEEFSPSKYGGMADVVIAMSKEISRLRSLAAPTAPPTPNHPETPDSLVQAMDPWRLAVDTALSNCALDCTSDTCDPQARVKELLEWTVTIALDPAVSAEAQALIERGRAQAPQPVAWLPAGYKMLGGEPTPEMLEAEAAAADQASGRATFRAMWDAAPAAAAPARMPKRRPLGSALAMRVLQSDVYCRLDDAERADCDELIRRNLEWVRLANPGAEEDGGKRT